MANTDKPRKSRARTRAIRSHKARTGDPYTVSARRVDTQHVTNWTWAEALDRLDALARSGRESELTWYAFQAGECIVAAALGRNPMPVLAGPFTDESDIWTAPAEFFGMVRQVGPEQLRERVVAALGEVHFAAASARDLASWEYDLRCDHEERGDESDDDGSGYGFTPGPADHDVDEWCQLENEAAGYGAALADFCEAARALIQAHVESLGPKGLGPRG